jgi:hypothetical protein
MQQIVTRVFPHVSCPAVIPRSTSC